MAVISQGVKAQSKMLGTIDRVAQLLQAVKHIDVPELEELVCLAHESSYRQNEDPPERFIVSRQALRMFWHFRCNLEAVEVDPAHG